MFDMGMHAKEGDMEDRNVAREAVCHVARVMLEEAARIGDVAPLTSAALADAADVILFGEPPRAAA